MTTATKILEKLFARDVATEIDTKGNFTNTIQSKNQDRDNISKNIFWFLVTYTQFSNSIGITCIKGKTLMQKGISIIFIAQISIPLHIHGDKQILCMWQLTGEQAHVQTKRAKSYQGK